MAFGYRTGAVTSFVSGTSTSVVLPSTPNLGDLVLVSMIWFGANVVSALVIKDANNNTFTNTTNSPSAQNTSRQDAIAFFLSAPSNASATINASWTGANPGDMYADLFSVSGGTASFDKDVAAAAGSTGTTVNTPPLTPTNSGELLYCITQDGGAVTAPAADATLGIWTGSHAGISTNGDMAEYVLSAGTGAQAPNFTQSPSGSTWYCMQAAFIFTSTSTSHFLSSIGAGG